MEKVSDLRLQGSTLTLSAISAGTVVLINVAASWILLLGHIHLPMVAAWFVASLVVLIWELGGTQDQRSIIPPERRAWSAELVGAALWASVPALSFSSLVGAQQQALTIVGMALCVFRAALPSRDARRGAAYAAIVTVGFLLAWLFAGDLLLRASHLAGICASWALCAIVSTLHGVDHRRSRNEALHEQARTEALQQRIRKLEEVNQAKNEVLTSASHELRQPVHALGLLVERLRVDPAAAAFRETADTLASIIGTLSESLGSLLSIARLDSGSVTPQRRAFPVNSIFDKIREEFQPGCSAKGLRLEIERAEDAWVYTDEAMLYTVVSNFVSNAMRYTDRGSIVVAHRLDERGKAWIDVTDTGRGVPESMKERIFREYVRLEVGDQATRGFGLGLAIVQRTCALLGLDTSIDSELGKGSRFGVGMPAAKGTDDAFVATSVRNPLLPNGSASMVGMHGLIVDNDMVVLSGMEAMLRAWGCRVVIARSVADLRAKLAHVRVDDLDFMIADFHLGSNEPTGLDAIRLVRSLANKRLPVAVLTGDVSVRADEIMSADTIHVLHKPLLPSRLKKAIETMATGVEHPRLAP